MLLRVDLDAGVVVDALTFEQVGVVTPTRDPDTIQISITGDLDPVGALLDLLAAATALHERAEEMEGRIAVLEEHRP